MLIQSKYTSECVKVNLRSSPDLIWSFRFDLLCSFRPAEEPKPAAAAGGANSPAPEASPTPAPAASADSSASGAAAGSGGDAKAKPDEKEALKAAEEVRSDLLSRVVVVAIVVMCTDRSAVMI